MPLFDRELVVLMRTALDDVLGIAVIVGCGRPQHPVEKAIPRLVA
jgi:hypothetical protein